MKMLRRCMPWTDDPRAKSIICLWRVRFAGASMRLLTLCKLQYEVSLCVCPSTRNRIAFVIRQPTCCSSASKIEKVGCWCSFADLVLVHTVGSVLQQYNERVHIFVPRKVTMKLSAAAVLLAVSGASAYTIPTRSSLRSLGQKSVSASSGPRRDAGSNLKMEGKSCRTRVLVSKDSITNVLQDSLPII